MFLTKKEIKKRLGLSEKIAKIGNLFFVKTCGEQHKTVRNLFDSVRY